MWTRFLLCCILSLSIKFLDRIRIINQDCVCFAILLELGVQSQFLPHKMKQRNEDKPAFRHSLSQVLICTFDKLPEFDLFIPANSFCLKGPSSFAFQHYSGLIRLFLNQQDYHIAMATWIILIGNQMLSHIEISLKTSPRISFSYGNSLKCLQYFMLCVSI